MTRFTSILRRLASPQDQQLLDQNPSRGTRFRVLGRVALRFWWAYLGLLFVVSIGTVSAGMDVYHRTESPQFCGACHEMGHNFDTWGESRHKAITCADCHAQPGLTGWVKAKAAGVKQLKVHFSSASISGIKIESSQRDTITANCKRCHGGVARVGERLGLGVSHRQHLDKGMDCVACHTGAFTHPKQLDKADAGTPPNEGHPLEARFVEVAQCFACHDGKTTQGSTTVFDARDESRCLKCHPDADHARAHGARDRKSAERKPCLDCHEHQEGEAHFQVGKPGAICVKCHEKEQHASTHSPYKKAECDECHRVMSPAYLFKVGPRPTEALCLDCHPDLDKLLKAEKPDPKKLSGFAKGEDDLHRGHATELREQIGGDWCLSCHAPHASDSERGLLRYRQEPDFRKPGVITLSDEGGTCSGGCHARKDKSWGPEESE
jgi:predicted CXXCH cytochrome family protein